MIDSRAGRERQSERERKRASERESEREREREELLHHRRIPFVRAEWGGSGKVWGRGGFLKRKTENVSGHREKTLKCAHRHPMCTYRHVM